MMRKNSRAPALAALIMAAGTGYALGQSARAILAGGSFTAKSTGIVPSAGVSTGAAKKLTYQLGAPSTVMSGGTFTLKPGALGAAGVARATPGDAYAYPTPFAPSRGHDRVTFTALPAQADIRIYTLAGELVSKLSKSDSTDSLIWMPVVNQQGSALASGVYVFVISSPDSPVKKGKLMIIK